MTSQHVHLFAFVVALLSIVGCSHDNGHAHAGETASIETIAVLESSPDTSLETPETDPDSPDPKNDEIVKELVEEIAPPSEEDFWGPKVPRYVRCDPEDADTILIIKGTLSGQSYNSLFRVPLHQRVVHQDGLGNSFRSGYAACGVSPEGHGVGTLASIDVSPATEETVSVSLWLSWTTRDQKKGKLDESFVVTIGKPSAVQFGDDTIYWNFEEPASSKNIEASESNAE